MEECLELRLQLNGAKHVYTADAYQALGNFLVKTGTHEDAKRGVDLMRKD